jgi:hypothetical protein
MVKIECPKNQYSSVNGTNKKCDNCQRGYYSAPGSTSCLTCGKGEYIDDIFCKNCPPGTYQPSISKYNLTSCILCPKGTYNPIEKSEICMNCKNTSICDTGSIIQNSFNFSFSQFTFDPKLLLDSTIINSNTSPIVMVVLVLSIVGFFGCILLIFLTSIIIFCKKKLRFFDIFFSKRHSLKNLEQKIKKKSTLGAIFTFFAIFAMILLAITTTMSFFLNNTILTESLSLSSIYNNPNLFISASISVPDQSNFCNRTSISYTGYTGIINTNLYFESNSSKCTLYWNCSNCNINSIFQDICYSYSNVINPAYTPIIFYELKYSSVINNQNYILNGSLSKDGEVFFGNEATNIFVSSYYSIYQTLLAGEFNPVLLILNYIGPIIKNINSYGMVSFITNTKLSTKPNLDSSSKGFSVCYKSNLSPAKFLSVQSSRQTFLNYIFQLCTLLTSTFTIFSFFFTGFDRVNKFVVPKIKKRNRNKKIKLIKSHIEDLKNINVDLENKFFKKL